MRRYTRSWSREPYDQEAWLISRGYSVKPMSSVQIEQNSMTAEQDEAGSSLVAELDSAKGKSQQVLSEGMEESSCASSSGDSDFVIEEEEELEKQQDLHSTLLEKDEALVADQVFAEMPQSDPVAVGVNQGGASSARVSEKGVGSELKAPWVNLFRDNRNLGKGIELDEVKDVGDLVQIEDDDVDEVDRAWGLCLVGLFAGKLSGMGAVRSLREGWKVQCSHWIHRSGWIVFKFQSEEDRLKVLNGGPYFAYGRNLMLKIMPRCFRFGNEDLATVPVWIQLPDLPLDCWNARALSKIVSKVGKPITTDKMTRTKERISFARVLVEVDASKELVKVVEVMLPTGVVYDQLVVFEFTPKYCKKCKTFSHSDDGCNKVSEGGTHPIYVPKRKFQPGGVDKSYVDVVGCQGGGRPSVGGSKLGEASTVKDGELLAVNGQPGLKGTGSKVVHAADAPAVGVVLPSAVACNSGKGLSGGSRPAQMGSALLPTKVGFPAVDLDASAVGVAATAIKGKQKMLSGQQGMADVLQHSDVEDSRLETVCPAEGLDTDVGWTRAGKKRKQKKKSVQSVVPAVQQLLDGEGSHLAPVEVGSASVSRRKGKGKGLRSP